MMAYQIEVNDDNLSISIRKTSAKPNGYDIWGSFVGAQLHATKALRAMHTKLSAELMRVGKMTAKDVLDAKG